MDSPAPLPPRMIRKYLVVFRCRVEALGEEPVEFSREMVGDGSGGAFAAWTAVARSWVGRGVALEIVSAT